MGAKSTEHHPTRELAPRQGYIASLQANPGLWKAALLWTVVVAAWGSWRTHQDIETHRQELVDTYEFQLNTLQESVKSTFRLLSVLPAAFSNQKDVKALLQQAALPDSQSVTDINRSATKTRLLGNAPTIAASKALAQLALDFNVDQLFLLDRFGTVIADASAPNKDSSLGASFRAQRYFTSALEEGSGFQFGINKISKTPAFYFSARIVDEGKDAGVIVAQYESAYLSRLFKHVASPMFATDDYGVIVLSNQNALLLSRSELQGPQTIDNETAQKRYLQTPKDLNWHVDSLRVGSRQVRLVERPDGRFLALSQPLGYGNLTAWVLVPLKEENSIIITWSATCALALITGYWLITMRAQRQTRQKALMQAQQDLSDMAHALPLTVFCYRLPVRGGGHFTFIGEGVDNLLGLTQDALQQDPQRAWQLMHSEAGQGGAIKPPVNPVEFPLTINNVRRWIRCESQCVTHPDGSHTYNGY